MLDAGIRPQLTQTAHRPGVPRSAPSGNGCGRSGGGGARIGVAQGVLQAVQGHPELQGEGGVGVA